VVVFGFAGEAGDYVGADGSVREALMDEFDAAGVVLGAVQRCMAARMWSEADCRACGSAGDAIGGGEEFDKVLVTSRGSMELMRRRSTAVSSRMWRRRFSNSTRGKGRDRRCEVNSAENDFAVARFGEALDFVMTVSGEGCGFARDRRG